MALATIFACASVVSGLAVLVLAGASWKVIAVADPKYAEALFTPGLDQAIYHLGPLRWKVLYLCSAPISVLRLVVMLRIAIAIQLLAFVSFVVSLIWGDWTAQAFVDHLEP